MIAVVISLTDCAASIPVIPKHACKIMTAGIRTSPLRNIARNVATALREIDWNSIFPYIVIGINTNDTHWKRNAVVPTAITSGSSLNSATNCPENVNAITARIAINAVPLLSVK